MNVFRYYSIRSKLIIAFLGVLLTCAALYFAYGYYLTRNSLLRHLDKRLLLSAETIEQFLPPDFVDRIMDGEPVSAEEKRNVMEQILQLLHNSEMSFLYAVAYEESTGRYILVAATGKATKEHPENGIYVVYEEPEKGIIQSLKDGKLRFNEGYDEYGWTRSAFLGYRTQKNRSYVLGADYAMAEVNKIKQNALLTYLGISAFSFTVAAITGIFLAGIIVRPLKKLGRSTRKLAESNFSSSVSLPPELLAHREGNRNECLLLASDINNMLSMLHQHITKLQAITQEKERAESELRIAGKIQKSYLPSGTLENEYIDVFAKLIPALYAAGDLFDYTMLDKNRLYFVLGDVSGKGVPAALFMSMALTLIRSNREQLPLPKLMNWVNDTLSKDNSDCFFVTLIIGEMNILTGEVRYCNAGHNPPVLYKSDGTAEYLPKTQRLPAGLFANQNYEESTLQLGHGDCLFLYSDGITEAFNELQELFGENRLRQILQTGYKPPMTIGVISRTAADIVLSVIDTVRQFAGKAPQSDDITCLCVLRK